MFILRKIDKKGIDTNIELDSTYVYISKVNENEFNEQFKNCYGIDYSSDNDTYSNIQGFIVTGSSSIEFGISDKIYPIFSDETSYIMTSGGKTFSKLY